MHFLFSRIIHLVPENEEFWVLGCILGFYSITNPSKSQEVEDEKIKETDQKVENDPLSTKKD